MTADAKVGLLLGLVFIVIIAFLVNGLPNIFHGGEATAAIDTSVPESSVETLILQGPVNEIESAPQNDMPLRPAIPPTDQVIVQLPGAPTDSVMEDAAQVTEAVAAAAATAAATVAAESPVVRRHQVKDGEYLTTIACLEYGPEVGKKKVTLEAIARANGLDSPDVLQVGQVLVMPNLDGKPVAEQAAPVGGTNALVEKFKDVLERVAPKQKALANASKPQTPVKAQAVEHVVQKGECLSEISSKRLGTSKRVEEIIKLNRDRIRNADDIAVGMILTLPRM